MARPQNGVNGNIPQPSYVFVQPGYNFNTQTQRNQNQNIFTYNDMSQILPNYVPQTYSTPMNNNSMRSTSPMVNQAQYAIYPTSFQQQQTQYNPYGFTTNYIPTQQYATYQSEHIAPLHSNVPSTNRKSSPLVVVDPTNNTDLDLSKYQNHTSTEKKTKALIDVSKFDTVDSHQNEKNKNNLFKEDKILEHIVEEIKENEYIFESKTEKYIDSERRNDNQIDLETDIKSNFDEEEPQNDDIVKVNELNLEEISKIESSVESENNDDENSTHENSNEEEGIIFGTEKDGPNYFLPIDKKESDATTLLRKLIYDREYLITIKSNILSQKKPLNLPCDFSEDIIYNESQNISCKKPEAHHSILTNNVKKQNQKFPANNYSKYQKQQPQPKMIHLNSNRAPVFERLKSSYLPPQLRSKDKDVDPYNDLKRNIKCNLNKITPQNFQYCLAEINKLNIKEKKEMSCLINEIFIKAVQEEAYSVTYAQFCNELSSIYTENQTFKGQLLKKCQDMFQIPIQEQLDNVRKEWMLKIDNELDLRIKTLYQSDLEEQVKKAKDKYFGNIRFIGELFLHQLLAGKVILNCIVELLNGKNDPDALLALCKLMETCGKQIDERNKEKMNSFFRDMEDLSKSKELDTRICFKIKDVIDMRKRNWVLRHIQQEKKINPKTIEEQKEEALAEAALAASKLIASQSSMKRNNRNVQHNSVRRQISAPQKPIAIKGLTFTSHTIDNKTVLGPARSNWGAGSKPKLQDVDEWTPMQHKIASKSRSREHSPQVKTRNKYGTLDLSEDVSGGDSRPSSPPIRYPVAITKAYRIKKEVILSMTDDERANIIFNDLLLTGVFDVDSWSRIVNVQPIIEKWIDDMMEKDTDCRRSIGDNFAKLINNKTISHEHLIQSFQTYLSFVDDYICDIPKLWDFIAEFLERFICEKNSNISFIESIFKELLPNNDVARCISMTLHAATSRLAHDIVGQVFHKSSMKWETIVPKEWEKFVNDNNLQFTIVGGAPLPRCGGYSLLSVSDELEPMLAKDLCNEDIFHFLEKHIDKPTWKSCECSRTITSCILKAMQSKQKSRVRTYLNDKFEIIKFVCQGKLDNENEVLKSVLNMANEFDYEILTAIYDVIMTRKIVSDEAFKFYLDNVSIKSEPNFDLTFQIISQLYRPSESR